MLKRVRDLVEGDFYDALPLCYGQLKPFGADRLDDSVWIAAECLYFEVEGVERMPNGGYVIWGSPYNMEADENEVVAIDIRKW